MFFRRLIFCSFTLVVTALIVLTACSSEKQSVLNVPEGQATRTLMEFAKQAEVEIMFNPQSVDGVKTNAVVGEYNPYSALRIMLEGTALAVDFDEETGAYGVMRNEP